MPKSTQPEVTMSTETPFAAFAGGMSEMQKDAVEWMAGASVPPFGGFSNLAAHPMGAVAAASAIGMGVASQMLGIFAGSMAGAMQAANMLANETTGGHSDLYGLANPLNFDLATGGFDNGANAEPVAVVAKPAVATPPEKAAGSAVARKAATPKTPAAKKPVAVADTVEKKAVSTPEAKVKPATAKPAQAKPAQVKPASAKSASAKATSARKAPARKAASKPASAKPEPVALAEPKSAPVAAAAPATVMPEDFVKPKPIARPDAPDDLKAISGVGPKLESVLNSLGIWTYDQIAALTPYEIAWVDDYLQFRGRIERDGWIAQAAELAKKG